MSGLGAIFNRNGQDVARHDIERVAHALHMYGPEKTTIRLMGPVAFAYTHFTNTPEARLQPQPVSGGDGRFTMIFDGRLDNREDLARALNLSDYQGLTDATLAIRCWEKWQQETYNKWVGEFAFVLWDEESQKLTAVRDQFGCRLLHYHMQPDRMVMASAPKGIHALPDIPREVDDDKIAQALCQIYTDASRSFFKDISRVPPASTLTVTSRGTETTRYYHLKDHIKNIDHKTDDEYVDEGRDIFETALKPLLRSPGPISAFMSGGLDSSSVAVTAANLLAGQQDKLPVYTWVPERDWDGRIPKYCYGDETPFVTQIAKENPALELNLIDSSGLGHYYKQDDLLHATEAPQRNALNMVWIHDILGRAQRNGTKVMLEGHFGNVTLSYGGDGVFTHLWRIRKFKRLVRELSHDSSPKRFVKRGLGRVVYPLIPHWLWALKEQFRGRSAAGSRVNWPRSSAINPEYARRMNIADQVTAGPGGLWEGEKPLAHPRDVYVDLIEELAGDFRDFGQGISALYQLELRDPFADRRVIEWSFGVPEDQYYRGGEDRWLIKRMMARKLPRSVLHKQPMAKDGIQLSDWHVRMTRDLPQIRRDLEEYARDPELSEKIDLPRLMALIEDWPDKSVVAAKNDKSFYLPVVLPLALQVAHFSRLVRGRNY